MIPLPQREFLTRLAWESIRHGWRTGQSLAVDIASLDPELQEARAVFVTLETREGDLRGCIGTLQADTPLAANVARQAFAAAFEDPRFPPTKPEEEENLRLHISVLTPAQPLPAMSEQEAVQAIRPGVDGVILSDGRRRATFLPSVWEQLPDPLTFLHHLKRKAGLKENAWPASTRLSVYQSEAW